MIISDHSAQVSKNLHIKVVAFEETVGDPIEIPEECDTVIMMVHEIGYDDSKITRY